MTTPDGGVAAPVAPRRDSYDVVVVGAGMGGLAAAALLARAGKSVLVVERHNRPGGYAHGFEREGYRFDVAVHMVSGCGRGGLLDLVLGAVGARADCEFIGLDPIYSVVFPDFTMNVSAGLEGFIESHLRHFPAERDGLMDFLRVCAKVNKEQVVLTGDPTWMERGVDPDVFPVNHLYRNSTVADVLDRHVHDARLRSLLTACWFYLGLPPSRLSFLAFATTLVAFLAAGSFYCRGGFQRLADALATAITRHQGELLLGSTVERIMVEHGSVRGIVLADGSAVATQVVISNADALHTFEHLVAPGCAPSSYLERLQALEASPSAAALYLGADARLELDERLAHEMLVFDSWNFDEVFARLMARDPAGVTVMLPSRIDPTQNPPGTEVVNLICLAPYDPEPPWTKDASTRLHDGMIRLAERVVPGLSEHVVLRIGAYPGTMERYTLNQRGAMYGWAPSPSQATGYRLENLTPVTGLILAGHWTQPGAAVTMATASGARVAQYLLGYERIDRMFGELERSAPATTATA